jgi:hypothetical protein
MAKSAVSEFLKVCLKLKKYGFQTILFDKNSDESWYRIELAPNYFWQNWYNENKSIALLKTQIQSFLSLKTKSPLFSSEDIASDLQLFEVKLPNYPNELIALRAAIWYNCPIVSYPTKDPWNKSPIEVNVIKLDEKGECSTLEKIINYFDSNKIDEISLRKSQQESIDSGEDLWKRKNELFPNLYFCGETQSQLKNWSLGKITLEQVKKSLSILNEFFEGWQNENKGLNVSRESDSVRYNPKMRSKREFYLSNGRKEFFEEHVKLNNSIRIHFYPNASDKKIYIGYIGKHLPTKKFKN